MTDINGTSGNDLFFFQGAVRQLTVTMVNPYSGATLYIDEEKNVNTASYEGFAGIDSLFLTNIGDAFFTVDSSDSQMISNIERIIAGDGGDVIILADDAITLGNMTVEAGSGDDIVWGNAGNDIFNGFDGNDIIDGGPGNDTINGQNNDDTLNGGDGNDVISGGAGIDFLSGDAGNDTLMFFADVVLPGGNFAINVGSPGIAGTNQIISAKGKNATYDVFDGGAGYDILSLTSGNDVFYLYDPYSPFPSGESALRLINVEQINAGAGSDIIDLTHEDHAYGDIVLNGEAGADVLWASSGNDVLDGGSENDNLHGGAGNDTLYGGTGDDILNGGPNLANNHHILVFVDEEHAFNATTLYPAELKKGALGLFDDSGYTLNHRIIDLLAGHPAKNGIPPGLAMQKEKHDILDATLGVAAGDLSVDYHTTATVTFVSAEAAYGNTLGSYAIADDGTISAANVIFADSRALAAGNNAAFTVDGDIGFFLVADGFNANGGYGGMNMADLHFVYDFGGTGERTAKITDNGAMISLVSGSGANARIVAGDVFHTTARGSLVTLNEDKMAHVVSGIAGDDQTGTLRIGFKDLYNLGDADFNDFIFDLNVEARHIHELLISDNDILYGGDGNDRLNGGVGMDVLYGGAGSDRFVFTDFDGFADVIKDFQSGPGGDILDISGILQGYDPLADAIGDFVRLTGDGAHTKLEVNADGSSGGVFTAVAVIENGNGTGTLTDLINSGNLAVV